MLRSVDDTRAEYTSLRATAAQRAATSPDRRTTDVRLADLLRDGQSTGYGAEADATHGTVEWWTDSQLEWDPAYQMMTTRSRDICVVAVTDHTGTHWMRA